MTSEQVSTINTSLTSAGQTVLTDFISVLPAVASIIAILFVITFVNYYLKKLRKAK